MQFTVTYRGADGAVATEAVDAASRGDCFAQMKARGISPMRVEEGKGRQPSHTGARRRGVGGHSSSGTYCWMMVALVLALALGGGLWWWFGREVAVPENDQHVEREASEIKSAKRLSERHDDRRDFARNEKVSTAIKEAIKDEYNAPVDLPLLDIKKWYTVCDYSSKATTVKKNRVFYELVNRACPAIDLTSKVRGLAKYRATATTSFYWVPFPDGIPCVVREVRPYADFIQLELTVEDEVSKKFVKNYYMDEAYGVSTVGVLHEFDNAYFSLCISMENPCCAAMSDLNKGDVVTSKNWGNLFVINTALKGNRTPVHAGGMREKGDLFDVKFAILKAVQYFESVAQ